MDEINIDVEAIMSFYSKDYFSSISDSESNYSDEWKTTLCIASAFKEIDHIKNSFETLKSSVLTYVNEVQEIDDQDICPEIQENNSVNENIDNDLSTKVKNVG